MSSSENNDSDVSKNERIASALERIANSLEIISNSLSDSNIDSVKCIVNNELIDNYDDSNSTDESKLVFVNKDDSAINKLV